MNKPARHKKPVTALAGLALLTAFALTHAANDDARLPQKPIQADDTKTMRATDPVVKSGRARFNIDISKMGLGERVDLLKATHLALVFNAPAAGQTCPFFDLKKLQYKVEEIQKDVYQVDATITDDEIKAVTEKSCLIITLPDTSKIKYLPAPKSPLQF